MPTKRKRKEAIRAFRTCSARGTNFGDGVSQDFVQADKWYILAARGGDLDAVENRERVERRMTPEQFANASKLASE